MRHLLADRAAVGAPRMVRMDPMTAGDDKRSPCADSAAWRRVEFRFVRLRCPLCGMASPLTDQTIDIRRDLLRRWWDEHKKAAHPFPAPIIEVAAPTAADLAHNDGYPATGGAS